MVQVDEKQAGGSGSRTWAAWSTVLGLGALVFAVGWLMLHGWLMVAAAEAVDRNFRESSGRAEQYPPGGLFVEQDSYYWLGYVRDQRAAGGWRIPRWTYRDNTPDGRAVHWASPYLWLLRGSAEVAQGTRAGGYDEALARGAVWIGPVLHLAAVVLGAWLLARRFGWLAAGMFAVALVAQRESLWAFHALRPDHQQLYGLTTVLGVVLLLRGGLGDAAAGEDARCRLRRRLWFVAAGLVGALGVWVSATVTVALNLVVVGVVALVLTWRWTRGGESEAHSDPEVWRWWGWAGAAGCLLAWLVEYAPALPWGRLEVNHPLYALQWLAAGEALRLWAGWRCCGVGWSPRRLAGLGLAAAGVCLPVILITLGPADLHALRDPLMRAVHRYIIEFKTYAAVKEPEAVREFFGTYGLLLGPLLLAPAIAFLRGVPAALRPVLLVTWLVTVVLLATGLLQTRWLQLFAGMLAILLAVAIAALAQFEGRRAWAGRMGAVLLALACLGHAGWIAAAETRSIRPLIDGDTITLDVADRNTNQDIIKAGMLKMISVDLGRRRGNAEWRALASLDLAPYLHYHAGIPAVASLYWENTAGMAASVAFLTDSSGETARAIARERGLTHIMLAVGGQNVIRYHELGGIDLDSPAARRTLVSRLNIDDPSLPLWVFPDLLLIRLSGPKRPYLNVEFQTPILVYRLEP